MKFLKHFVLGLWTIMNSLTAVMGQQDKPNVVLIYVDDLGYGDLGCYGAEKIKTPHLDALASDGIRFTNGHATAATCTPSRYSLMTGNYPFRQSGTGILPGDAKLIIPQDKITLPRVFKQAGYQTAVIGKWHLGLGDQVDKNWNGSIKPGPLEVGYDYSFIFPATADRVPTVFLENHHVLGVDKNDPIVVSYLQKIGHEPTGKEHPELLKMKNSLNHGHDHTIVNGIGRIGWMSGGKEAKWVDEELTLTFADKAIRFIQDHYQQPFFLTYNATEPHVPRMPATIFKGKSGLGYRGDAILQLDYTVGQLVKTLKDNQIYENTIIIFSSDNGPVLDDGYDDGAIAQLNGHNPFGPFSGGKYSAFEAGTRVPFIITWPKIIKKGTTSDALICQVDLLSSFASFLNVKYARGEAIDSENHWKSFMGTDQVGRSYLIKSSGTLSVLKDHYKYIKASKGAKKNNLVNIELGNDDVDQLYDLNVDKGERINIADRHAQKVAELKKILDQELTK
ncbi:sulfatase family protein [Sphingobacterium faecium]|uniref:sulfatase family protein n=1 Tax=Sphingobacterium faecium TaxID=34087 RepID=UPI000D3598BE|nr:arylsulfatase [Sphingobacterium faecium]PTX10917.1 arylsulfatase A-like enzyme [Sphingobacterium faecium]